MKWKRKERIKTDEIQWHKWFAWYPVILDEYVVWLEMVYCRYTGRLTGHEGAKIYEYSLDDSIVEGRRK